MIFARRTVSFATASRRYVSCANLSIGVLPSLSSASMTGRSVIIEVPNSVSKRPNSRAAGDLIHRWSPDVIE